MVAFNPDNDCSNARLYYYDFLNREGNGCIPGSTLEHIAECQYCQDETNRLSNLLVRMGKDIDTEQNQRNAAITTVLKLHFAYIGESVTCKTVKPFLPALAVPDLEIRIPTPVTSHLDKCRACSGDLLTLRNLGLTDKQLYRLGRLFADRPAENNVSCSQAQTAVLVVASMDFHKTDAEVLKHLCTCPDCRKALYQYREATCANLRQNGRIQEEFPCEQVSATDIFDYCFPYGIDPADDRYVKFRESLTSHLRRCPICLAKMQQLHSAVFDIVERTDSGIVTRYELAPPGEEPEFAHVDDLYADWPIKVQVLNQPKCSDAYCAEPLSIAFPVGLKKRVPVLNLKRFIKPAAAAAAIFVIALLLLTGPPAKAVDFSQIYEAIGKIKNVCISSFVPGKDEPSQKIWVSRISSIRLQKSRQEAVLFNLQNKSRKIKDLSTGSVQTTTISGELLAKTEDYVAGSLGLVPFSPVELKDIAKGAQWTRLNDKDMRIVVPGAEVYDLTWTEKGQRLHRWRFFIVPDTNLPKRVERYKKSPIDSDYKLKSFEVVTCPTDSEIEAAIQSIFGQS